MNHIKNRNFENVVEYKRAGKSSDFAFYTTEHFYPLLYVLGATQKEDSIQIFNQTCLMGSMSMTCYLMN